MIGSHDTLTCFKSTSCIYNNAKRWWKCQSKTIGEQYARGIRMFDIRVYWDNNKWRGAHGKAGLKATWKSLKDICEQMKKIAPEAIYRIVLERTSDEGETEFLSQTIFNKENSLSQDTLCDLYPNLWRVDVKSSKKWNGCVCNNNQALYDKGYKFAKAEGTWTQPLAYELHGSVNMSNFYKVDLRKEAKKITGDLYKKWKDEGKLQEILESKDVLYFLDYCTNEF